MRKHWQGKLLAGLILCLSLSSIICHFLEYWAASTLLLIPAVCLLCLWLGILIGLSGKYSREDFGLKKVTDKVKFTEVN